MIFNDRAEAGQILASFLRKYSKRPDAVVLALPRGGVPVAAEISRILKLPLDIFTVRKLGVPGHEELAMGAVATGGVRYLNQDVIDGLHIDAETVDAITATEQAEIKRREQFYRGQRPVFDAHGKTLILVDDGLATGATMIAAIRALRQERPARIVVAVPAGAPEVCREIDRHADETICAAMPELFRAVSRWYQDFSQTTDEEVRFLLDRAWREHDGNGSGRALVVEGNSVPLSIVTDEHTIQSDFTTVAQPKGTVIFAHGSGSSRHSPRNKYVASMLNSGGFATLLLDLLTPEEESVDNSTGEHRFNIHLLASRLVSATDQLMHHPVLSKLPVGYFGSSTGAGAALCAAAQRRHTIGAVVSRGGRPDLAGPHLSNVVAPTLFIVGELDPVVLELNRKAAEAMPGQTRIEIVSGATHLFEEPGALEEVAALAREWFTHKMPLRQAA